MADAAAGPATAPENPPPPAVGTATTCVAHCEAPVKQEFLRSIGARVHVGAVCGGRLPATQAGPNVQAQPQAVRVKSKKQAKKDRQQHRFSTAELCTMFALGKCPYGDSCRFNHDVTAYLESKPSELPGSCPFSAAEHCPFGVTCRWASKHAHPDPLTEQFVVARQSKEHVAAEQQGEAQPQQHQPPAAVEQDQSEAQQHQQQLQEQHGPGGQPQGWWRQDGTIPREVQELPVSAEPPVQEAANTLSKDLQLKLRKQQYDFSAADGLLTCMGIRNTQLGRGQGGRSGKGGRSGQGVRGQAGRSAGAEQGQGDMGAAACGAAGPEPSSKRHKVDQGTGATASQGGAPATVGAGDDAAFVDELAASADLPASDTTVAATEGGAAGSAGGDADGTYVEGKAHPREKRQFEFSGKLFLAPLTTVGNLPFRRLCKSLGADITCGEMALATNLLQGQPSEWALLKRHPSEDCFGVQLCGGYPDAMARCAQLIEETCTVDFVDLNFGCPIDVVCSKGAGSACLLKPQRMEQIVRTMSAQLSCPLTFKMRKGYNDGQDVAHTLVPKAAGWGASAITLHGRTREQRYSKLADWPYIKQCVDAAAGTGIEFIGNGDVFSFEDHYRHLEECPGLATTYIARGALIKPWLFTEIKERRHWDISAGERLEYFKRFCSYGLEHWGSDTRGVENTRRFLLEWLSFTHRYIPVGLLEVLPQRMHHRPPAFVGRSDLETLLASDNAADWVAISEMLLGPSPPGFVFTPKHKANSYASRPAAADFPAGMPAGAASLSGQGVEEEEY